MLRATGFGMCLCVLVAWTGVAGGADDDATLFEVPDGAAPDVWLADVANLEGAHDTSVDALVLECLPPWWGVLQVVQGASGVRFKSHRKGRRNPSRDSRTLVELLWLDDAITFLEQRDSARGVRGKPRRMVWDKVCDCYTLDEIAENVRERLKARTTHQDLPPPS